MTETITITNTTGTQDRYSSKYGAIYARVDEALRNGEDLTLSDFGGMKSALAIYKAIGTYYRHCAYISISKYGRAGIEPTITVSPRGV